MSDTINYTINIKGQAGTVLDKITISANKAIPAITGLTDKFNKLGNAAFALNNINSVLQNFASAIDSAILPGIALDSSMKDLSAITGVTGKKLQEIEGYARTAAKTFGGSAAQGVESYKVILSKLSPEIAKFPEALASMGKSVSTLSKTMGGDTLAATDVLTTAMNQFQISLENPVQASKKMSEMMNVMSASAKVGSAELPQIKAALENSGLAAKLAGVTFEELNASIQVLDKSGKKGAEGGIALRNALSILSEGRFMPEKTQKALMDAGVSISGLGDKSKTLTDRLRLLKPVLNDSALMSQIFGRENANAGIALISGIDQIDEYTKAITGTNAANEQAAIVMSGFSERMSRMQAKWDNLKISIFQHTQNAIPAFKAAVFAAQGAAATLTIVNSLAAFSETTWLIAIKKRTKAMWQTLPATWAMISSQGTWLGVSLLAAGATTILTGAVKRLGMAIYSIPIIGWIAAGITIVATAFKILWDKSEKFRQILFSVWEVVKAVFYNVGIVVKGLWDNIVKPYFTFIWNFWKTVINGIFEGAKWLFNGIASIFTAVGKFIYEWVILPIYKGVTYAINGLLNFFSNIWNWISNTFTGVVSWLDNNLINPLKGIFSSLWDFVSKIFTDILNNLKSIVQPVIDIWNKIFPKDKFKDINVAYQVGVKKGSESWAKDHPGEEAKKINPLTDSAIKGILPIKKTKPEISIPETQTNAVSSGGQRNNSTIQINFKNMVENIVFDGNLESKRTDLEREITSVMSRVLGMAQATG